MRLVVCFRVAQLTAYSTNNDQLFSRFLDLPGELRNRIYTFAVSGHIVVIKAVWKKYPACRPTSRLYAPKKPTVSGQRDDPIMIEEEFEDKG